MEGKRKPGSQGALESREKNKQWKLEKCETRRRKLGTQETRKEKVTVPYEHKTVRDLLKLGT